MLFRHLSHVMNVATPTKDCLELIYELLVPVMKARTERRLTRQEVTKQTLKCSFNLVTLLYFLSKMYFWVLFIYYFLLPFCRKACYWTVKRKWRVFLQFLSKITSH